MHQTESSTTNTFKNDNPPQKLYIPEGLKLPVMPDFLEVLQEKLKGQNVSLETHSGASYSGMLREIYSCNGQLVLELVKAATKTRKEISRYIPYGSIRNIQTT
jgi:hypothetical protein